MKKLFTFLSIGAGLFINAQTTIYSENFGKGTGSTNTLITDYKDYQNTNISYTGNAEIRTLTPSTGYAGASGEGCVFLAGTTANPAKTLVIDGINTSDYKNITLSLGQHKGTNAASNELKIEVSTDGNSWSELTYTRPSGTDTSIWILISPTGTIPAAPSLKIRFTNIVNSNVGFRIDDIKLVGEKNLATQDIKKDNISIYPTIVSNGIINIISNNDSIKTVKIYDTSSKLVLQTQSKNEINVSQLPKGVYIINIEEQGKTESKKIIIK